MDRHSYQLFSPGQIGNLRLPNRLVRSATWDPCLLHTRKMTSEVLDLYQQLARGGVGLIISGALPVADESMLNHSTASYADLHIDGLEKMADVVHATGTNCKVVAQLETSFAGITSSDVPTPYFQERTQPLSITEIHQIITFFVQAIIHMQTCGFDGVQLHAAHGGLISNFLSPYSNRRQDEYGGSIQNRVRIIGEIVAAARAEVGSFPILIKVNCTDYLEGGIDLDNFPDLTQELEDTGLDAIELSGGMWQCLARSAEELGFLPVPSPEAHTHIQRAEKQSYFLKFAERLNLKIPVILVGGNRNVELLEAILQQGKVDFISLCRPLINEPNLPNRWLSGMGSKKAHCTSCNSCLYAMIVHPGREQPALVSCIFKQDKAQYKDAKEWLNTWVEKNIKTPQQSK